MSNLIGSAEKLKIATDLATTDSTRAFTLCNEILNEDPDFNSETSQQALFLIGFICQEKEWSGLAYHIYGRCGQLNPGQSTIWSNMGMCFDQRNFDKATACFERALARDGRNSSALGNLGLVCLQTGDPRGCIAYSERALAIDPDKVAPRHNIALAKLMLRDWSGWTEWYDTHGVKPRKPRDYGLPEWDGKSPGTVLIYGEQGCGDEVQYASILPDVMRTNKIVIDADPRLVGLFKRSFGCPVYGDRFGTATNAITDHHIDYQLAMGQLPYWYRRTDASFPGTAYLKPDPDRVLQWGTLIAKIRGNRSNKRDAKVIGYATSAGSMDTGSAYRTVHHHEFGSLLNSEHILINFDYGDVDEDLMARHGVNYWARAVKKGVDLDETIALLSCCDVVISPCTAIAHFAGALGVECHVLVPPKHPPYQFFERGAKHPWYNSVTCHRTRYPEAIDRIVKQLSK